MIAKSLSIFFLSEPLVLFYYIIINVTNYPCLFINKAVFAVDKIQNLLINEHGHLWLDIQFLLFNL